MQTVLAFGMPGGWEWIIIVLVVVLLFGAKKIPELARGLGKGIREFKDATKEIKEEIAFAWSVGGGIAVMATRWLSFGATARLRRLLVDGRHGTADLLALRIEELGPGATVLEAMTEMSGGPSSG